MWTERVCWLIICLILVGLLAHTNNKNENFKSAFLTSKRNSGIEAAALKHFANRNGVTKDVILQDFYVGYADFNDQECIRLVPRKYVTGRTTTYCFTESRPARIVSIDRGSE